MKLFLFIVVLCKTVFVGAQSLGTRALNATGGNSAMGNLHLEWSVGEMTMVNSYSVPGILLTQGLLQPTQGINSPLPVQLVTFAGKTINNRNILNWTTSQELNSHHFDVERSATGSNFQMLERLNAAGSSTMDLHYAATDSLPYTTTFYRLKKVDIDGTYTYSPTIRLELTKVQFSLFPNPATGSFLINGNTGALLHVSVYDLSGRMVIQKVFLPHSMLMIDAAYLKAGNYLVTVVDPASGMRWSGTVIKL